MAEHLTAPAKDIEVATIPFALSVGITAVGAAGPRPDLAGLRVKLPNRPEIYLIDPDGYRRWIPNPETYNNLFRDWNGVVTDINIDQIALGSQLTYGAVLARAVNSAPVYIVSNGMKRWITSPAVMDKYHFNWSRVYVVPHVLVDFIPHGANWT
jgi:hypothetical protein